jgi:hypothetical protein
VASLGGWTTPTGVYGTHGDFEEGQPGERLSAAVDRAVGEAEEVLGTGRAG